MSMSVALVILVLAYFSPVVALFNDTGSPNPPDGEYTVTYGAPSFLSMNATIISAKWAIRMAFVCEHEVHGYDDELRYKVWGGGGRFSIDIKDESVYYGSMIRKFAQLCPKFGNGQAVAPDLAYFDGDAKIMETTVVGIRVRLERSS